jgi:hypothetical protein
MFRLALGSTQLPSPWMSETPFPAVKQLEHEAEHSHSYSVEVKNKGKPEAANGSDWATQPKRLWNLVHVCLHFRLCLWDEKSAGLWRKAAGAWSWPQHHPMSRYRFSGATPLIYLYAFRVWTGTTVLLPLLKLRRIICSQQQNNGPYSNLFYPPPHAHSLFQTNFPHNLPICGYVT